MTSSRSTWASKKAADLRRVIAELPVVYGHQAVRKRMDTIRLLEADARKFERIARAAERRAA
jgi:hypothetical protein